MTPQEKQEYIASNVAKNKAIYDKQNSAGNEINYSDKLNVSYAKPVTPAQTEFDPNKGYVENINNLVIKPQQDLSNTRKKTLLENYNTNKGRISDMQSLIDKYRTDALAGQETARDAKTSAETQQAFQAERKYADIKGGQEKAILSNLASMGAIGTTGALDIATLPIDKEYQANLDQAHATKTENLGKILDFYVSERARIEKEYINDKDKMNAELSQLDKEYDDAVYEEESKIATLKSGVQEKDIMNKMADAKQNKEALKASFLDTVTRGAYDQLGDEAINAKAKQLDPANWETLAFQARTLKNANVDPKAREGQANKVLETLASDGKHSLLYKYVDAIRNEINSGKNWYDVYAKYASLSMTPQKISGGGGGSSAKYYQEKITKYNPETQMDDSFIVTYQQGNPNPISIMDASGHIEYFGDANDQTIEEQPVISSVTPIAEEQRANNLARSQGLTNQSNASWQVSLEELADRSARIEKAKNALKSMGIESKLKGKYSVPIEDL